MVVRPHHTARVAARSAFTLLEVLIVVAILVVLAGVSSMYVFRYLDDAKRDRVKADVQTITKACQAYQIRTGEFPPTLQALLQPPQGGAPYLENGMDAIKDPWQKEYQYNPAGPNNGGLKPDIWTTAPDGVQIGNWPGSH
jgi:general secretion pathway protein G